MGPQFISRLVIPQIRYFASKSFKSSDRSPVDYSRYLIRSKDICLGANIVEKSQAGFIERFGKLNRPARDGLNLTIPFIETIRRITMREFSIPIDPQRSTTKDNVQVETAGAVHFKVVDPEKACYETYDLLMSVVTHSQASMRSAVGLRDLDTLNHDRAGLNKDILSSIQPAALKWGVEILRYEITEVNPDPRVSEAMDAQSIAERKRRETILAAEAQRQHDITVSEGKRLATINEAEADKQKIILAAEADKESTLRAAEASKESTLMKAEADARSIEMIGEALRANPQTAQYLLAKDYMGNVSRMLPKSTVFLPDNIGDISKLVATATSISEKIKSSD
ncbi:SPFH/Band 7/PHB domain protein [uncultured virus]|nr:SPFH/Band 7/PHB domain protein [uncultured virus]